MRSVAVIVSGPLQASGFGTRLASMLKAYSGAGLKVDLYHFRFPHESAAPGDIVGNASSYIQVEMRSIRKRDHLRWRPPVMASVERASRQGVFGDTNYDLIQVETTNTWPAARRLKGSNSLIVFHDDDHMKYRRLASSAPDPAHRVIALATARRYKREQRLALEAADACWFVSAEEMTRLCGRPHRRKCHVVPNGADDAFFDVGLVKVSAPPVVTFVGPANYDANTRSLSWFLDRVWPLVTKKDKNVRFRLVGLGWAEWVGRAHPRVETPGFVRDLAHELDQSRLVIAPLVAGGGTKIKTLEAMAAARPVVATPVGAEGLPPASGVVVTEDPAAFATAMHRWLADPQSARRGGESNRNAVRELRWSNIWDQTMRSFGMVDA